jgi:hypothetical protein
VRQIAADRWLVTADCPIDFWIATGTADRVFHAAAVCGREVRNSAPSYAFSCATREQTYGSLPRRRMLLRVRLMISTEEIRGARGIHPGAPALAHARLWLFGSAIQHANPDLPPA